MNKLCECGCGREVTHKNNKFLQGHTWKGKKLSKTIKLKMSQSKEKIPKNYNLCKCGCGKKVKCLTSKFCQGHNRPGKLPTIRLKMSNSHKGKKFPEQRRIKTLRRICSPETKIKLRIGTLKHIEKTIFNGSPIYPCTGKNEKLILDQIQNSSGIHLLRNDPSISYKIGKFCDGYSLQFNLPIEVLENHHFKSNGELSNYDQKREILIASRLACMIYYISEKEFLNNPEKEIQRFKDFLELLKN